MKKVLPYVATIGIGAFAGNMINIGLSYALYWMSLEPIDFMTTFATDFPLLLGPTIVTLLPAFVATIAMYFLSDKGTQARRLWLYALLGLVIINIQTVVYHLPVNLAFIDKSIDISNVETQLVTWLFLHWIRIVLAITSGIFALRGFVSSLRNHKL